LAASVNDTAPNGCRSVVIGVTQGTRHYSDMIFTCLVSTVLQWHISSMRPSWLAQRRSVAGAHKCTGDFLDPRDVSGGQHRHFSTYMRVYMITEQWTRKYSSWQRMS